MDFDFTTLLYILFAGIYYFFSNHKKKSKKSTDLPVPPVANQDIEVEQESKRPSFEDLLREFTGQPIVQEPEPLVEQPKITYQEPKKEEPAASKPTKQMARPNKEYERFEEFKIEEEPVSDWTSLLREEGGARKAFIYSEIFKRKY